MPEIIQDSHGNEEEISERMHQLFLRTREQAIAGIDDAIVQLESRCETLLPPKLAAQVKREIIDPLAEKEITFERIKIREKVQETLNQEEAIRVNIRPQELSDNNLLLEQVIGVLSELERPTSVTSGAVTAATKIIEGIHRLLPHTEVLRIELPEAIASLKSPKEYSHEELILAAEAAQHAIDPDVFTTSKVDPKTLRSQKATEGVYVTHVSKKQGKEEGNNKRQAAIRKASSKLVQSEWERIKNDTGKIKAIRNSLKSVRKRRGDRSIAGRMLDEVVENGEGQTSVEILLNFLRKITKDERFRAAAVSQIVEQGIEGLAVNFRIVPLEVEHERALAQERLRQERARREEAAAVAERREAQIKKLKRVSALAAGVLVFAAALWAGEKFLGPDDDSTPKITSTDTGGDPPEPLTDEEIEMQAKAAAEVIVMYMKTSTISLKYELFSDIADNFLIKHLEYRDYLEEQINNPVSELGLSILHDVAMENIGEEGEDAEALADMIGGTWAVIDAAKHKDKKSEAAELRDLITVTPTPENGGAENLGQFLEARRIIDANNDHMHIAIEAISEITGWEFLTYHVYTTKSSECGEGHPVLDIITYFTTPSGGIIKIAVPFSGTLMDDEVTIGEPCLTYYSPSEKVSDAIKHFKHTGSSALIGELKGQEISCATCETPGTLQVIDTRSEEELEERLLKEAQSAGSILEEHIEGRTPAYKFGHVDMIFKILKNMGTNGGPQPKSMTISELMDEIDRELERLEPQDAERVRKLLPDINDPAQRDEFMRGEKQNKLDINRLVEDVEAATGWEFLGAKFIATNPEECEGPLYLMTSIFLYDLHSRRVIRVSVSSRGTFREEGITMLPTCYEVFGVEESEELRRGLVRARKEDEIYVLPDGVLPGCAVCEAPEEEALTPEEIIEKIEQYIEINSAHFRDVLAGYRRGEHAVIDAAIESDFTSFLGGEIGVASNLAYLDRMYNVAERTDCEIDRPHYLLFSAFFVDPSSHDQVVKFVIPVYIGDDGGILRAEFGESKHCRLNARQSQRLRNIMGWKFHPEMPEDQIMSLEVGGVSEWESACGECGSSIRTYEIGPSLSPAQELQAIRGRISEYMDEYELYFADYYLFLTRKRVIRVHEKAEAIGHTDEAVAWAGDPEFHERVERAAPYARKTRVDFDNFLRQLTADTNWEFVGHAVVYAGADRDCLLDHTERKVEVITKIFLKSRVGAGLISIDISRGDKKGSCMQEIALDQEPMIREITQQQLEDPTLTWPERQCLPCEMSPTVIHHDVPQENEIAMDLIEYMDEDSKDMDATMVLYNLKLEYMIAGFDTPVISQQMSAEEIEEHAGELRAEMEMLRSEGNGLDEINVRIRDNLIERLQGTGYEYRSHSFVRKEDVECGGMEGDIGYIMKVFLHNPETGRRIAIELEYSGIAGMVVDVCIRENASPRPYERDKNYQCEPGGSIQEFNPNDPTGLRQQFLHEIFGNEGVPSNPTQAEQQVLHALSEEINQ